MELAHRVVRAGKFEMYRAGQQAGDSGKRGCCGLESDICRMETQAGFHVADLRQNCFFWGDISVFAFKVFN